MPSVYTETILARSGVRWVVASAGRAVVSGGQDDSDFYEDAQRPRAGAAEVGAGSEQGMLIFW